MSKLLFLGLLLSVSVCCGDPLQMALYVDAGARGGVVKCLTIQERSPEIGE